MTEGRSKARPPGRATVARAWAAGAARGFCVGTADLVPGVSGATVALVLGIYERLVAAIRGFDGVFAARLLRLDLAGAYRRIDTGFLIPLAAGVALAATFFTRVVSLSHLMTTHRTAVQSFFFGLVAAALVFLVREALDARESPRSRAEGKTRSGARRGAGRALRPRDAAAAAAGLAAGWGVAVVIPTTTPEAAWFVFLSGALAASAMILPGISGAYVLVLLKKYGYVLAAIGRFDLAVLAPFGLGVVAGLIVSSRVLKRLLDRFRRPTLFALAGLVAGSLWSLWPYQLAAGARSLPAWPEGFDPVNLGLAVAGAGAVAALHLASRRRPGPLAEAGGTNPARANAGEAEGASRT